ncbi:MAG: right-handed parallel beta-helix repeat-containing protein, partial [Actinobacteria bacterium]|nr:right-handed parallel beta-helix repeat-containing protein [Actinomycetota bacterium]
LELTPGGNVLAIAGFNQALDSSDFSLNARLEFEPRGDAFISEAGGCGGPIFAFGERIVLRGVASPEAQSVTVEGRLADVAWITSGDDSYGLAWSATVSVPEGESAVRVAAHPDPGGLEPALHAIDFVVHRTNRPTAVVAGAVEGDTTWSAGAGPYRMTGDVVVPPGATLTIEGGTVVLVENGARILVEGRIVADGAPEAPIVMNAYTCDAFWEGIVIRNTGTDDASPLHVLRHVRFSHGESDDAAPGFVGAENAKLLVEDCVFESVFADVIDTSDARLTVRACRFEHVQEGVHCARSATHVEDCVFRDLLGDSDGIDFDTTSERSTIAGCLFDGCTDDGIDLGAADVEIRGNVFRGVADKAISIEENGPTGPSSLTGNLIVDCGTAVALKSGLRIED